MLVEFSVENFRSFKEKQTLSLVASKDKAHEGNLIRGEKENLLKAAAVYGANASGKSNLVRAIRAASSLIKDSATKMNPGDRIARVVPFRLDPAWRDMPSSFEIVIEVKSVRYEYGFSVTSERVHDEWLTAYPKGRPQRWFERTLDPETGRSAWEFGRSLKGEAELLRERTRDNGLAFSTGANLNVPPFVELFLWFLEELSILGPPSLVSSLSQDTARYLEGNAEARDQVAQLLRHADLGIGGFDLVERTVELDDTTKAILDTLPNEVKGATADEWLTVMDVRTTHSVRGADVAFRFEDESDGTQRFFALLGPLTDALDKGSVMVVDELECSMHPLLARKVIELFQNPRVNDKGAQLVFATHDSTLMDHTLLRRDQIWFTEKNADGATDLFSLYDFKTEEGKPRVNEAFARRYLAGRYGAVPQFGPTLEDAEFK